MGVSTWVYLRGCIPVGVSRCRCISVGVSRCRCTSVGVPPSVLPPGVPPGVLPPCLGEWCPSVVRSLGEWCPSVFRSLGEMCPFLHGFERKCVPFCTVLSINVSLSHLQTGLHGGWDTSQDPLLARVPEVIPRFITVLDSFTPFGQYLGLYRGERASSGQE